MPGLLMFCFYAIFEWVDVWSLGLRYTVVDVMCFEVWVPAFPQHLFLLHVLQVQTLVWKLLWLALGTHKEEGIIEGHACMLCLEQGVWFAWFCLMCVEVRCLVWALCRENTAVFVFDVVYCMFDMFVFAFATPVFPVELFLCATCVFARLVGCAATKSRGALWQPRVCTGWCLMFM